MGKRNKGGGMDMGAKKPLTFKEQLEKARAEGTVEKSNTSKYIKKKSRGDKINALLKAANVPNMNKGGGMDMGNTSARTTAYAKAMAKKDDNRLTRSDIKIARDLVEAFGSKKTINKMKSNIQDKNRVRTMNKGGGMDMGQMPNTVKPEPRGNPGIVETVVGKGGDYIKDLID